MNTTPITNQQKSFSPQQKVLVELIKSSGSMLEGEKQGWIAMLSAMNEQQMAELKAILETEKNKLAEIDKKYTKEMKVIERDYILKYLKSDSRKAWEKQRAVEKKYREASSREAEELLQQL